MDSRQCDFTPPGEVPKICHSALPRISNQGSNLRYNRLDKAKSEIRVICPHCPVGSSVDKLEFTIRIVSLDDKPKYWALSYVVSNSTTRQPFQRDCPYMSLPWVFGSCYQDVADPPSV